MLSNKYIIRDIESYGFDETLIGRYMVFLGGPRQVGKTSLVKNLLVEKLAGAVEAALHDISGYTLVEKGTPRHPAL